MNGLQILIFGPFKSLFLCFKLLRFSDEKPKKVALEKGRGEIVIIHIKVFTIIKHIWGTGLLRLTANISPPHSHKKNGNIFPLARLLTCSVVSILSFNYLEIFFIVLF